MLKNEIYLSVEIMVGNWMLLSQPLINTHRHTKTDVTKEDNIKIDDKQVSK